MQRHALPYLDLDVIPPLPWLVPPASACDWFVHAPIPRCSVCSLCALSGGRCAHSARHPLPHRYADSFSRVNSVSLGSKSAAPGVSCVSVAMRPFPALNPTWSESLTIRCCLSDRQQGWKRAKDDCPSSMLVVFRPRSRSCHQLFWRRSPLLFLAASHPQTAKTVA